MPTDTARRNPAALNAPPWRSWWTITFVLIGVALASRMTCTSNDRVVYDGQTDPRSWTVILVAGVLAGLAAIFGIWRSVTTTENRRDYVNWTVVTGLVAAAEILLGALH